MRLPAYKILTREGLSEAALPAWSLPACVNQVVVACEASGQDGIPRRAKYDIISEET